MTTDTAAEIKRLVPMPQAARFYGFEPNQSGFIKCFLHNDKTGSLKIYSGTRGWHCFSCDNGGSVIDFVMKLYNLSFRDAIARLNEDFGLGLTNDKPDPKVLAKQRRERQELDRQRRAHDAEYRRMTNEYRRLWWAYVNKAPRSETELWDDEFCEALDQLPWLDEWFKEQDLKEYVERHRGEA